MRRALGAALLVWQSTAAAGGGERFELRQYEVTGTTAETVRAAMDANGPRGRAGEPFAGRTDWEVLYRYRSRHDGALCRIESLEITHSTVMVLPKWVDEAAAPPALRERWRTFHQALRRHEDGHRRHGQLAAAELGRRLAALPPRPDCGSFAPEMQALADEIIGRHAAMGPAYDRETDHGRAQGARFP